MGLEAWTSEGRFAVYSREGLLYSPVKVCCWVTSEKEGLLCSHGKVCRVDKGRFAVESRLRDTHFQQLLMGLEAWT